MSMRGLTSAAAAAAFLAAVGATVDAQLPRMPKAPSIPGVSRPAPAAAPARKGVVITDDVIERYLKAIKVQKEVLAKELGDVEAARANARAQKAKVDALQSQRAEGQMNTLMKTAECKDTFKEKDSRSKEIARLEDQVAAADTDGNDTKSEALRKKLDPLTAALDLDADRACGGKGTAALHDCMEAKKAALARQGIAEPMLTIQAQGECMGDPATSGFGGSAPSAEEEAAQRAENAANKDASERMQRAQANADKAGMESAGLTSAQWGVIDHCVRNRVNGGPGCDEDSNIVIDRYKEQLKAAVSR
jgi:hypothetical protein